MDRGSRGPGRSRRPAADACGTSSTPPASPKKSVRPRGQSPPFSSGMLGRDEIAPMSASSRRPRQQDATQGQRPRRARPRSSCTRRRRVGSPLAGRQRDLDGQRLALLRRDGDAARGVGRPSADALEPIAAGASTAIGAGRVEAPASPPRPAARSRSVEPGCTAGRSMCHRSSFVLQRQRPGFCHRLPERVVLGAAGGERRATTCEVEVRQPAGPARAARPRASTSPRRRDRS